MSVDKREEEIAIKLFHKNDKVVSGFLKRNECNIAALQFTPNETTGSYKVNVYPCTNLSTTGGRYGKEYLYLCKDINFTIEMTTKSNLDIAIMHELTDKIVSRVKDLDDTRTLTICYDDITYIWSWDKINSISVYNRSIIGCLTKESQALYQFARFDYGKRPVFVMINDNRMSPDVGIVSDAIIYDGYGCRIYELPSFKRCLVNDYYMTGIPE